MHDVTHTTKQPAVYGRCEVHKMISTEQQVGGVFIAFCSKVEAVLNRYPMGGPGALALYGL